MVKLLNVLPLAVLSSAFVLPPQEVLEELEIEDRRPNSGVGEWLEDAASSTGEALSAFKDDAESTWKHCWDEVSQASQGAWDGALDRAGDAANWFGDKFNEVSEDAQAWLEESEFGDALDEGHHGPHRPGKRPGRRPGRRPHKPHHHKPNQTVFQLIAGSKHTTKLAKLISEYDDLVEFLNSTAANYTIFAPTDRAFEKIPEKAPKPSKEQLKALLSYHVVPGFYPAGRVLATHTVATLLIDDNLGSEPQPQRLVFKLGLRGLTVNFYSRIVGVNFFGTNGVVHAVDSLLLPPPRVATLIDLFPGTFSTLELGLGKTGLLEKLNTTHHAGGTLFAPSNFAFQKLGPKINAFLFSKYGQKYLKALLEYHVVPGTTLYSDAIYQSESSDADAMQDLPKKGHVHIDLPTLLKGHSLSVDITRFAGFISFKINGFASVAVQDGLARDGVIQVVRNVLIPPKKIGGVELDQEQGGDEITVEELKERLGPFVAKNDL